MHLIFLVHCAGSTHTATFQGFCYNSFYILSDNNYGAFKTCYYFKDIKHDYLQPFLRENRVVDDQLI